jgi:anti-anti-sigma factor
VERSGTLAILTFTAHAIRDVESVIARELGAVTAGTAPQHLLLDFTHVEYLNSMELGTLVTLHKRVEAAGGRLTLFNLSADVFRLFAITRLDTFLDICREADAAGPEVSPAIVEAVALSLPDLMLATTDSVQRLRRGNADNQIVESSD